MHPEANSVADSEAAHVAIASCVRAFFDRSLRDRSNTGELSCNTGGTIALNRQPGANLPSIANLLSLGVRSGYDALASRVSALIVSHPGLVVVDEPAWNAAGYRLLAGAKVAEAVLAFRTNVLAHPKSANAYDSLADGYRAANDRTSAVKTYQQLLAVAPNDDTLSPSAREQLMQHAQAYIDSNH